MIRRTLVWLLLSALVPAAAARAQSPLTLEAAVERALSQNPRIRAAEAAARASTHRLTQARAGYWPRIDLSESWQRGNHPVFVFSSLLAQRRFTAADFALDALNHPDPAANFRTAFTIDGPLFDGAVRSRVAAARIDHGIAVAGQEVAGHELAATVTSAFARVLAAAAARRSSEAAAATARADRDLAANRRDAGLVTDADVLQLDLHVTRAREGTIRAELEERVAREQLNALMADPLDTVWTLEPPTSRLPMKTDDLAALEAEGLANRPDLKIAVLQERLAATARSAARSAFLPQVGAQAGWEVNGGSFGARESSWVVGASVRINLFHGFADKARVAEANETVRRRALETVQAETAVRLDVRAAAARLETARASEAVARAALTQATERSRIIRDRYEAGLADVTSLLRSSEAVVQAEVQRVAAEAAVLTETAALLRAVGRQRP